jgi:hypothetical protein
MLRGIGGKDGYIGNVIACQRLYAFIDCRPNIII